MKYEVAIKGCYKRKRTILGTVEDIKDVGKALESLGWQFFEKRISDNYWINQDGVLLSERLVSLKKI